MQEFSLETGVWKYFSSKERTLKAIIMPSGQCFILPSGFTFYFKKSSGSFYISHGKMISGKCQPTSSISFRCEEGARFAIDYFFSSQGLAETRVDQVSGCIPYRKQFKRLRITLSDVLIPLNYYSRPFKSFDHTVSYIKENHPGRAWPKWVKDSDLFFENLLKKGI